MYAKELFALKSGVFIKGLFIVDLENWKGRAATLSENGWCYQRDDLRDKFDKVQTLLFQEKIMQEVTTYTGEECLKIMNSDFAWLVELQLPKIIEQSNYLSFTSFKKNNPVGIHLNEFVLAKQGELYAIYSKILLCSGTMGYIGLTTTDLNSERLELF